MVPQWNSLKKNEDNTKIMDADREKFKPINDQTKNIVTPLIASAPLNCRTVTSDIQLTINNCVKRSNSCIENKYKCVITSERLNQLRKIVENAVNQQKVFTVRGGWGMIRQQLLKRDWLEKIDPAKDPNSGRYRSANTFAMNEELVSNLPAKQDWESPSAYAEKCEKLIINRLLQRVDVNFFWSTKRDQIDVKQRTNPNRIVNRFSRSLFASKEGLALLLQNYYWFTEPEVAHVNFPRCYVLGFPEHFNHFVDNFRMTACIGLLKYVTHVYDNTKDKFDLESPDGKVPLITLKFATDRCLEYIASQKHLDLDRDFVRIMDHEWQKFLSNYYLIVHNNEMFKQEEESVIIPMILTAKTVLKDVAKYWTEYETDGHRNIWILKPGNKCRGRGILLVKYLKEVEKIMTLKLKYVVQKYIERPLIIYNTKFDIRQWFLVTCTQPLTIWMYKECYLRFSSQNYNLENFHESLHLTNYAVQCKYTNMEQRDINLPKDNMWDCFHFKDYLKKIGKGEKWEEVVFPGMKQSIVCSMLASQDTMDRRQNTFEMYGADFLLSEDFRPWLLEINCSPDMSPSTSITKRMCPQFLSDIIKVVIDKRKDPKAETGNFELIYKQVLPRAPPYLGSNLSIRGKRLLKTRPFRLKYQSKPEKEKENKLIFQKKQSLLRSDLFRKSSYLQKLPKIVQLETNYQGPVIEDLIDELQKCCNDANEEKIDFVEAPADKKSCTLLKKGIRNNRGSSLNRKAKKSEKSDLVHRKTFPWSEEAYNRRRLDDMTLPSSNFWNGNTTNVLITKRLFTCDL